MFALELPFPAIVATAALLRYVGGRLAPDRFTPGGGHGSADRHHGPALIDDDTPPPWHARFRWMALARVALAGLLLWAAPIGLLTVLYGWDHTLT